MVYTSSIDVYVCKRNRCTTKILWVLNFLEVGGQDFFFSKSQQVRRFLIFHVKLNVFHSVFLFLSKITFFFEIFLKIAQPCTFCAQAFKCFYWCCYFEPTLPHNLPSQPSTPHHNLTLHTSLGLNGISIT